MIDLGSVFILPHSDGLHQKKKAVFIVSRVAEAGRQLRGIHRVFEMGDDGSYKPLPPDDIDIVTTEALQRYWAAFAVLVKKRDEGSSIPVTFFSDEISFKDYISAIKSEKVHTYGQDDAYDWARDLRRNFRTHVDAENRYKIQGLQDILLEGKVGSYLAKVIEAYCKKDDLYQRVNLEVDNFLSGAGGKIKRDASDPLQKELCRRYIFFEVAFLGALSDSYAHLLYPGERADIMEWSVAYWLKERKDASPLDKVWFLAKPLMSSDLSEMVKEKKVLKEKLERYISEQYTVFTGKSVLLPSSVGDENLVELFSRFNYIDEAVRYIQDCNAVFQHSKEDGSYDDKKGRRDLTIEESKNIISYQRNISNGHFPFEEGEAAFVAQPVNHFLPILQTLVRTPEALFFIFSLFSVLNKENMPNSFFKTRAGENLFKSASCPLVFNASIPFPSSSSRKRSSSLSSSTVFNEGVFQDGKRYSF